MRVLILSPSAFPKLTGNAITTERWRRSLTAKGHFTKVLSSDGLDTDAFLEQLKSFHPDLIHVHHAYKTAALLLDPRSQSELTSLPLVVSPGGTDINLDFGMDGRREAILTVLGMARIIVTQSHENVRSLLDQIPDLADKIISVPKACCWFGNEPCDLRGIARCNPDDVLFFLPAGIRPVKGNLECLLALERVYDIRPRVRFVAAGPVVDSEYAGRFEREVNRLSIFARWIPAIPPAAMRCAYLSADIVLNASFSEGLSNSLLEAVASGRPVLASDIPGNRHTVLGEKGDPHAGLLFDPGNTADFLKQSIRLIDDPRLRQKFGEADILRGNRIPNPENEADGLIAAYRSAISRSRTGLANHEN
jgi:L-malate glycosyltransferase